LDRSRISLRSSRTVDVAEVLLLALVDRAEHLLEEHLGEAEHRVERRPQLVRHAGEELRLVPAGALQRRALVLQVAVELRVEERQGGLRRERLQQAEDLVGEVAGALAPHHEGTDDLTFAEHRDRDQRSPAGVEEDPGVRVQLRGRQVGHRDRTALPGRPAHQGVLEADADGAEPVHHRLLGAVDRAHVEAALVLGVVQDRPAVGRGQLDRVLGDRGEHLVDVEARAHRLADGAQRLELLDLPCQLRLPRLQLLHEVEAVDRERRLPGEG
jgi:hypothetical protein